MNTSIKRIVGVLVLVSLAACTLPPPMAPAEPMPNADETRAVAEQAYIFAYPMLENYKTMYMNAIDIQSPSYRAPFNQLYHFTQLGGPQKTDVVRTNNDTLNSIDWLDLRAEPMVISVPEIQDRYYTFQLVDMYTFNFAYIGTRATGTAAGSYMVTSPAWKGETPAGINGVFQSEGNFVYSLTRTEVDGEGDLPNVQAIQQQYKVQPLSAFLGQPAPPAAPNLDFPPFDQAKEQSAGFIEYFNFLLGQVAVDPSEKDLIASFGNIGVGPNRPFDVDALDPATRDAINAGVATALKKIELDGARLGEHKNGWVLPGQVFGTREQMDGHYLTRAAAAYWGLYGNSLEEAYYPTTKIDPAGNPLDASRNRYMLKFTKDQIPQVNAFWSLTMYDADQMMVDNPIDRYSIGDRTEGLQYDADGSLEIYLQHDSPGKDKESNWLPAPDGSFSLTLRLYLPQDRALDPLYAPPGVTTTTPALASATTTSPAETIPLTPTPDPGEVRAIAEEAYIFAYPMLENYETMYRMAIATEAPSYLAPFNQFFHQPMLMIPERHDVVRPNNDTPYSVLWLDLRAEPVVISVPEIRDRYYSFQLVDMYTFDFAYIGTRATGTAAGSYLVASPAWKGDKPAGIDGLFQSEGNFVLSLARTEADGEADMPNVQAIQQQYKAQPLSAFLGQPAPPAAPGITFPVYDQTKAQSADFIQYVNFLLGQLVIDPSEQELIAHFARIGIGPDRPFDADALDPATRDAITAGINSALDKIKHKASSFGEQKNGWNVQGRIFGTREELAGQYLTRAAAAYHGLYGNVLEEAYYTSAYVDVDGNPLDASKSRYVLKFTKDQIPAVDAFWSVTMYDTDGFLVENPMRRYSIGDQTEGLQYGADGSLEIYLQRDSPGEDKESNWLPAPNGPFNVDLRMYLPKSDEIGDPLYAPPGIQKQD